MPKVAFSTKMWQQDFRQILAGGYKRKHERCLYPFDYKMLILNNIDDELDLGMVKDVTGADLVVWAEDYAEPALKFFSLKKKDLTTGYLYSICEFVELYLAEDFDYLCHFASDTLMHEPFDWITPSIKLMEQDPTIITTAPNNEDSIAYGMKNQFFSDQAYLLKVKSWRKHNTFSYPMPELPQYPPKGGELFEKRAGRYLHSTNQYRQLIRDCWYDHQAW